MRKRIQGMCQMKLLKDIVATLAAVLLPIKPAIVTIFVLVIADLILGLLVARKSKDPITSAGFRRTITKLFVFELALIAGFLAETYLIGDSFPVSKIISAFIGLTEIKSIIENLNIINGENIFASLIVKLGSENDNKR